MATTHASHRSRLARITGVLLILIVGATSGDADVAKRDCGPRTLQVVLAALSRRGRHLHTLGQLAAADHDQVTTLSGMERALSALDVPHCVAPVGASPPTCITIALFEPTEKSGDVGHFVVIFPIADEGSQVIMVSPPDTVQRVNWGCLTAALCPVMIACYDREGVLEAFVPVLWIGILVLVLAVGAVVVCFRLRLVSAFLLVVYCMAGACGGERPVGASALAVPSSDIDCGVVAFTSSMSVGVKNVSAQPLQVEEVLTSCGCTAASLHNKDVPIQAGETRVLDITMRTPPASATAHHVTVFFGNGEVVAIRLRARGAPPTLRAVRSVLDAGAVLVGRPTILRCEFVGAKAGSEAPELEGAVSWRSASPSVASVTEEHCEIRADGVTYAAMVAIAPREVGEGSATVVCSRRGEDSTCQIRWRGESPLGLPSHVVVVEGADSEGTATQPLFPLPGMEIADVVSDDTFVVVKIERANDRPVLRVTTKPAWDGFSSARVVVRAADGDSFATPLRIVRAQGGR